MMSWPNDIISAIISPALPHIESGIGKKAMCMLRSVLQAPYVGFRTDAGANVCCLILERHGARTVQ